jgi:glycosyltransferase involved in cell wall biosynthesis
VPNGVVYRLYNHADIGSDLIVPMLADICGRHQVDVVEAADHLGETAGFMRRNTRPPVIVKCHYNDVLRSARYAQACHSWQKPLIDLACLRGRERLRRERYSIECADAVISPAARMLEELARQRIRLPPKVGVLPNPIAPIDEWSNREADAPTMLLVGRVDIGKGIEYLPRLLDDLLQGIPGVRLEIAGGDSYARCLGSTSAWLCRRLGTLSSRVKFLGGVTREALDDAYRRAWVVVVPSRWDTFPTVVLEAMARGKAIVASPSGGMPEMLAGTGCPIADPATGAFAARVKEFLQDRRLRETAGRTACLRAKSVYNPSRIAVEYVSFLGNVL